MYTTREPLMTVHYLEAKMEIPKMEKSVRERWRPLTRNLLKWGDKSDRGIWPIQGYVLEILSECETLWDRQLGDESALKKSGGTMAEWNKTRALCPVSHGTKAKRILNDENWYNAVYEGHYTGSYRIGRPNCLCTKAGWAIKSRVKYTTLNSLTGCDSCPCTEWTSV